MVPYHRALAPWSFVRGMLSRLEIEDAPVYASSARNPADIFLRGHTMSMSEITREPNDVRLGEREMCTSSIHVEITGIGGQR